MLSASVHCIHGDSDPLPSIISIHQSSVCSLVCSVALYVLVLHHIMCANLKSFTCVIINVTTTN